VVERARLTLVLDHHQLERWVLHHEVGIAVAMSGRVDTQQRRVELDRCVIAEATNASVQSVSNHLQRMADQRIVATRRDGTRIYYRLIDPCVGGVMELGLCLLGHNPAC
jgi:DNA-binding transcriptional ArsR family regulator